MILSSVSVFGLSVAGAAGICSDLFDRIEVDPSAVSGPKASEYSEVLDRVDSLLGNLQAPTESKVTVDDQMIFSSFRQSDFSVHVGLRPAELGKKHPKANFTTLTHEYGHAILEKNLREHIPNFKEASLKAESNSDLSYVPGIIYTGLHELFADSVVLVATKNPEALYELNSMRRKSLFLLKQEYETLKKITPPEEFYLDNPREPMPLPSKYTREDMILRNMKHGSDHRLHQKWQEFIQDEFVRMDPYFILLPARWHLWQVVKTRISSENYQRAILTKIFPIFRKEMKQMLENPPESLSASDIEILNYRIIRQIDEALI
jgi:hypothetical protein